VETAGNNPRGLLEIAAPPPLKDGRILLLEQADRCATDLRRRLLDGMYDKPFILDQGALRFLHFDLERIQSLMCRDDPDALCLRYTRKMMAFLLFNPHPARILILGLGGGSLPKFCYRHLPSATITTLEIDPNVVALREEFCVPADDERFHVLEGDGVDYLARRGVRKDIILVDAYDRNGSAPRLATAQFFRNVRRRLTLGGVLVMNIYGDTYERACQFARIRGVFGSRVIALPIREDDNLIVLAFRSDQAIRNWARRERLAHTLQKRFGLNFPRFVRKMQRSPTVTVLHPLT
jgi:spermidine synthase